MGGKPKTPKPTAQELELQRNQRGELDDLTRNRNESLKALKRTLGGRRNLLGSGSELGIRPAGEGGRSRGGQAAGVRGGAGGGGGGGSSSSGGGILSSGGGRVGGGAGRRSRGSFLN